jgi:hypothetical protein
LSPPGFDDRIPVFNYADTFDIDQNFNDRALGAVNANGEILVDVDVEYGAYQAVKSAALAELTKLYDGQAPGVDAHWNPQPTTRNPPPLTQAPNHTTQHE